MNVSFCDGPHGRLAYHIHRGLGLGVVFLHGLKSDMQGGKATALANVCAAYRHPYVRFDCFAHGQSEGEFKDFTIGHALADSLYVLDHLTDGPQILVGSSMGGWLTFLLALARPERVHAIVGVAPAPDFTDQIYFDDLNDAGRAELDSTGQTYLPSDYGDPYLITRALIMDGRQRFVMDQLHRINCPLRILHGQQDTEVKWQQSLDITARWGSQDVELTYIKDGDHRLSRETDLKRLESILSALFTCDEGSRT